MMVTLRRQKEASVDRAGDPSENADLVIESPPIQPPMNEQTMSVQKKHLSPGSRSDSGYDSHSVLETEGEWTDEAESERGPVPQLEESHQNQEAEQLLQREIGEERTPGQCKDDINIEMGRGESGLGCDTDTECVRIEPSAAMDRGQETFNNVGLHIGRSRQDQREVAQNEGSGTDPRSHLLNLGTGASLETSAPAEKKSWKKTLLPPREFWSHPWFTAFCVVAVLLLLVILVLCAHIVIRGSSPAAQSPSPLEPCPPDWLYNSRKCYHLHNGYGDWEESQSFCASYNASLVLIDSSKELTFIMDIIGDKNIWIGLRQRGDEYQWANGTTYNQTLFSITDYGECVYIQQNKVRVSGCHLTRNYMCNKEPYL